MGPLILGKSILVRCIVLYGCVLKWWYPTTMGFPTKNDHFGVFWGYQHLRKHLYNDSNIVYDIIFDTIFFGGMVAFFLPVTKTRPSVPEHVSTLSNV